MIICDECGLVVTDERILQVACTICGYRGRIAEGFMKEEKEPQEPKEPKEGNKQFTVSDKEQEEIAKGYDNDGPFGIGMIGRKGK